MQPTGLRAGGPGVRERPREDAGGRTSARAPHAAAHQRNRRGDGEAARHQRRPQALLSRTLQPARLLPANANRALLRLSQNNAVAARPLRRAWRGHACALRVLMVTLALHILIAF